MATLAVIAMICGPLNGSLKARACYKNILICVERKQVSEPDLPDAVAVKECLLEM